MSSQQLIKLGAGIGLGIGGYLASQKWMSMDCDWTTFHSKMNPEYFRDRIIWITGASAGIGAALSRYLCSLRVNVRLIVTARREAVLLQMKQELLDKYGEMQKDHIMVLPMDLNCSDTVYLRNSYKSILSHFGVKCIDILINNAGFSMRSFAVDFAEQDTVDMVNVNLITPIVLTKMVLHDILHSHRGADSAHVFGHIVNISSVAARYLPPTRTSYVATKAGLLGYGYALFEELKEYKDVSVTTICPGAIQTDVDIAARGKRGEGHKKRDSTIQSGMSADRCAQLICVAVCNKIVESWPMKQPSLTMFYRCFYLSPSSMDGREFISHLLRKDAGYITSKL